VLELVKYKRFFSFTSYLQRFKMLSEHLQPAAIRVSDRNMEIIRCSMLTLKLANVLLLDGLRRLILSVGIVVYSTESLFCYIICYIQYTNFMYYNLVYSYFHYVYLFFHVLYLCLVIPCVFRLFSCCQCYWLLVVTSASL